MPASGPSLQGLGYIQSIARDLLLNTSKNRDLNPCPCNWLGPSAAVLAWSPGICSWGADLQDTFRGGTHGQYLQGVATSARLWLAAGLARAPWGEVFNPPTSAAFAALAIGCTPALKGLVFGETAPLAFLRRALEVRHALTLTGQVAFHVWDGAGCNAATRLACITWVGKHSKLENLCGGHGVGVDQSELPCTHLSRTDPGVHLSVVIHQRMMDVVQLKARF